MKATFVDAGDEAAPRDMPRAGERAPHEALHTVLQRGVDEVLALLLLASGVVGDFLPLKQMHGRLRTVFERSYALNHRSSSRQRRPSSRAEPRARQSGW